MHQEWRCVAGVLLGLAMTAGVAGDTTFTYQGELKENGGLANGSFNLDVSLWDAVTAGNQIGSTIMFNGLPVSDGRFTVELDFGAAAFDNSDRWLEISVDGSELAPRQPITRVPYSIQTRGIFVDDSLKVGIGTTVPVDELHVRGGQAVLRLEDDDSPLSFTQLMDASPTQLRLNKVNNAGQVLLDINPKVTDGTSSVQVRFFRETDTTGPKNVVFLRGNFTTQTSARIGVDGADSFFQAHGGNFGIGTTSPRALLHVVGDGNGTVMRLTNGGSGGTALIAGDVGGSGRAASFFGVTSSDLIRVENSGTGNAALFVGDVTFVAGNVGIGTTSPEYPLHVVSNDSFGRSVVGESDGRSGYGVLGRGNGLFGTGVKGDGSAVGVRGVSEIGIGVTGTSDTGIGVLGTSNSTDGYDFYAGGAGQDYGSSSSIRWKSNVRNIDQPLERVASLRGVYFDWDKDHGGHHDVGMIAEEVGKILPEIVAYEANGVDANGMDYGKLTPLLIEAVNELRAEKDAEIASLENEVAQMRERNGNLESRLARLEALVAELAAQQGGAR